jgi:hypothetical protein
MCNEPLLLLLNPPLRPDSRRWVAYNFTYLADFIDLGGQERNAKDFLPQASTISNRAGASALTCSG